MSLLTSTDPYNQILYIRCVCVCLTEGSVPTLACYIWTSGNGGRQLAPAAPWCCPCAPRLHSGSPDRRVPSPTFREREAQGGQGRLEGKRDKPVETDWERVGGEEEKGAKWGSDTSLIRTQQQLDYSPINKGHELGLDHCDKIYSHMARLMCHHKGRRETIFMVQSAASYWMAHARHWGVT